MRLEQVRALKQQIQRSTQLSRVVGLGLTGVPRYAIGIGLTEQPNEYRLAVRVKDEDAKAWFERKYSDVLEKFKDEVEIRSIGETRFEASDPATPLTQSDDLSIGISVRHPSGPTGTLGFFARRNGTRGFVSCNHVIARANSAKANDRIVDSRASMEVGRLVNFHKLSTFFGSKADCAFASVDDARWPDRPGSLGDEGELTAERPVVIENLPVRKIGGATALTRGRITSREMDGFTVDYEGTFGSFFVTFNNVIEIESTTLDPATNKFKTFCDRGDSGSLVYTDDRKPVGLLFFEKVGGPDGSGLAYANPLAAVEEALGVTMVV